MKNTVKLFVAYILGSAFLANSSCNKSAYVVIPTIIQLNALQSAGDTLVFKMVGDVTLDGQNYPAQTIIWQVTDANANSVTPVAVNFDVIKFVPEDVGQFTISAKILYNSNKQVTVLKQVNVDLSASFLQSKLMGNWIGSAHNNYGINWTYTFQVDSINGHYFAMLTSGNIPWVTWYGEGNDNIHTPLKRFVVNNVLNERATGYWYVYYGDSQGNGYAIHCDVTELRFSNNYNHLNFDFSPAPDQHYTYSMTRQ